MKVEYNYVSRIRSMGTYSLGVTIPKEVSNKMKLRLDEKVIVSTDGKVIEIRRRRI